MKLACSLGLFGLMLAFGVAAQEAPKAVATTGQKGELVPSSFRAYIVADERFAPKVAGSKLPEDRDPKDCTDRIHDLIAEHGLNPVIGIFIKEDAKKLAPTSGVGKLAAEINKLLTLPEYRGAKLAGFAIFLKVDGPPKSVTLVNPDKSMTVVELDAEYPDDEKRDLYRDDIRDLANGIKAPNVVFGLAPAKSKAAVAWGIADDDEVTVVIFNRIRVVNRWKFKADAGPTDEEIKQILAALDESVKK